jgi:hypothetical protein
MPIIDLQQRTVPLGLALATAGALALIACGSEPADVAGDYTLSITNGSNGCGLDNWTEGDTSTGIPFTVTQSGSQVTGTVGGTSGLFFDLWLGGRVFTGTVEENTVHLSLYGTAAKQQGNCTYTVNATVSAVSSGDVLQGQIRYTAATNGNPDCASLEGCVSSQSFNGTRPPQ